MVALQGRQWWGRRRGRPAGETAAAAAALRGGCFTCGGRKGATSCSKRQRGKEKEDEPELDGEDGKRHGVVYFQTARSFSGIKVNQDSSMIYLQNMYLWVSRIQFCQKKTSYQVVQMIFPRCKRDYS